MLQRDLFWETWIYERKFFWKSLVEETTNKKNSRLFQKSRLKGDFFPDSIRNRQRRIKQTKVLEKSHESFFVFNLLLYRFQLRERFFFFKNWFSKKTPFRQILKGQEQFSAHFALIYRLQPSTKSCKNGHLDGGGRRRGTTLSLMGQNQSNQRKLNCASILDYPY